MPGRSSLWSLFDRRGSASCEQCQNRRRYGQAVRNYLVRKFFKRVVGFNVSIFANTWLDYGIPQLTGTPVDQGATFTRGKLTSVRDLPRGILALTGNS